MKLNIDTIHCTILHLKYNQHLLTHSICETKLRISNRQKTSLKASRMLNIPLCKSSQIKLLYAFPRSIHKTYTTILLTRIVIFFILGPRAKIKSADVCKLALLTRFQFLKNLSHGHKSLIVILIVTFCCAFQ